MSLPTPLPTSSRLTPRGDGNVRRQPTNVDECRRRIEAADVSFAEAPAVRLPTATEMALRRVKHEQQERVARSTPTPPTTTRR